MSAPSDNFDELSKDILEKALTHENAQGDK